MAPDSLTQALNLGCRFTLSRRKTDGAIIVFVHRSKAQLFSQSAPADHDPLDALIMAARAANRIIKEKESTNV